MVKLPVIVIGAGGHARVLIAALKAMRRDIIGILETDMSRTGQTVDGIRILGNDDKVKDYAKDDIELVHGIGSVSSTEKRKEIYLKFKGSAIHLPA